MPAVSDQSEKDCLKYCRHSICQVDSIRMFFLYICMAIYNETNHRLKLKR